MDIPEVHLFSNEYRFTYSSNLFSIILNPISDHFAAHYQTPRRVLAILQSISNAFGPKDQSLNERILMCILSFGPDVNAISKCGFTISALSIGIFLRRPPGGLARCRQPHRRRKTFFKKFRSAYLHYQTASYCYDEISILTLL